MKHFFIILSVFALFSGSIFAATLKDQIINSAYEIK
jgi:hypothetical protein